MFVIRFIVLQMQFLVEILFLSISSCTRISVFALFTNGHVDLVTGSESSTY